MFKFLGTFPFFKSVEEDDDIPVDIFLERERHPLLEKYYTIKHKISDYWYSIKVFFDRLFHKGIAKADLWSLDNTLAEYIYPRLVRFRNSNLHGYPHAFSERGEWEDEETYNAEVASGQRVGGEFEAWLETIDEMLFGFEFLLFHEMIETKKGKEFWIKYYSETPWDKVEKNKHYNYHYYMTKNTNKEVSNWMSSGNLLSEEECKEKGYELRYTKEYYHNWDLEREAGTRAQQALVLFGRYFGNLWD